MLIPLYNSIVLLGRHSGTAGGEAGERGPSARSRSEGRRGLRSEPGSGSWVCVYVCVCARVFTSQRVYARTHSQRSNTITNARAHAITPAHSHPHARVCALNDNIQAASASEAEAKKAAERKQAAEREERELAAALQESLESDNQGSFGTWAPLSPTGRGTSWSVAQEQASMSQLPPGWERRVTPTGEPYYVNHIDKTTSWDPPGPTPMDAPPSLTTLAEGGGGVGGDVGGSGGTSAAAEAARKRIEEEAAQAEAQVHTYTHTRARTRAYAQTRTHKVQDQEKRNMHSHERARTCV